LYLYIHSDLHSAIDQAYFDVIFSTTIGNVLPRFLFIIPGVIMLISTFELLVKRQLPNTIRDAGGNVVPVPTRLAPLSRPLVQGYFLTVANINSDEVKLVLDFKAVTAVVDLPDLTATILDSDGNNILGDLVPDATNAYKYSLTLAGNTTALFILQPDIIQNDAAALSAQNIELRGYVEVSLDAASVADEASLLITPEHRGTFYRSGITPQTPRSDRQLGEIAYSLPTASGGALFELTK
jgi:hypothetical protein